MKYSVGKGSLTGRNVRITTPTLAVFTIFMFLIGFAPSGNALSARTFYVKNPMAKLLSQPNLRSGGQSLTTGTAVRQIGEQGLFYRVKVDGRVGWVCKLHVSPSPRKNRLHFAGSLKRSRSIKARARASAYTQTAAARGLTRGENLRTRGHSRDYDFGALQWLESSQPDRAELQAFLKTGKLKGIR